MNNQVIETIKNRRSSRHFLKKKIERGLLEKVVEAGFFAPSSYNTQGWHFTVLQNRAIIGQLNSAAKEAGKYSNDPNLIRMANSQAFDIFYGAPCLIIVSGEKDGLTPLIDSVSATQNMLLAAESLGLGTCWNGIVKWYFESDESYVFKEQLNIPETHQPLHAIAIGYKAREYQTYPRRDFTKVNYID